MVSTWSYCWWYRLSWSDDHIRRYPLAVTCIKHSRTYSWYLRLLSANIQVSKRVYFVNHHLKNPCTESTNVKLYTLAYADTILNYTVILITLSSVVESIFQTFTSAFLPIRQFVISLIVNFFITISAGWLQSQHICWQRNYGHRVRVCLRPVSLQLCPATSVVR